MSTLTITGLDNPLVQLSTDALRVKAAALHACIGVVSVSNRNEARVANETLNEVRTILSNCERSRSAAKEQVLMIIREIDSCAYAYTLELLRQSSRIGKLLGEFNAANEELERVRPTEVEVRA